MSSCGTKDTPPLQMGAGPGEWATGAVAALAALAGRRAPAGAEIEVSALEVMAVAVNNYPTLYRDFTGGAAALSRGGDWPSVVRCKDGWIGVCLFTGQQWNDFASMIGRPDLENDERFLTMRGRGQNRALVESVLRGWFEQHTAAEIHELGGLFRIPVALIGTGESLLDADHLRERRVFVADDAGNPAPRSPILVRQRTPAPARATLLPSRRPLDGVTVVDLTAFWAGPYATHLLATLGADVIKIESPRRPDGMRNATVASPGSPNWLEYGPTFHGANPAKRSVAVDFSVPEGRELVLALAQRADVLVENFTPRVLDNAGLGYDVLRARRPDLIVVRMPGFGLDGPWADHPGFAQTMEQASGIAWLTGLPEGEPLAKSTIDPIEGMHAAFAVLAALEQRARTGEGRLIEVPMIEVAINIAAEPLLTWAASGHRMDRQGNRGPRAVPQGVYRCADSDRRGGEQWVALAVETDEQWREVASLIGRAGWLDVGRAVRRMVHDEIDAVLEAWFAERDRDEVVAALLAKGVPAAPVWNQTEQDELPQLMARGFYQAVEHPVAGTVTLPGIGMRSADFDLGYRAAAPTIGQHTDDVLRRVLGLGDADIARLRAAGSIG
jgi:crotonobetainyl-CoA:carnitine CoA-transferase CaiB-like acyl-CoA transferase